MNKHAGSRLEDFLREEGILDDVRRRAAKQLLALQLADQMKKQRITKIAMAKRMKTSRTALDRLLDPTNPSVTLATLGKAASALGCTLRIELTHT